MIKLPFLVKSIKKKKLSAAAIFIPRPRSRGVGYCHHHVWPCIRVSFLDDISETVSRIVFTLLELIPIMFFYGSQKGFCMGTVFFWSVLCVSQMIITPSQNVEHAKSTERTCNHARRMPNRLKLECADIMKETCTEDAHRRIIQMSASLFK